MNRLSDDNRFSNQFAALKTDGLYQGNIGLLCEEATYCGSKISIV
jgi:hypothetical protein